MNKKLLIICYSTVLAGVALSQMREITGFKVPDYDEDNNLISQISGDKALFREDGQVELTNLKIETFEENTLETTITSPICVYDREKKTAQSQSKIRIERENMVITGENYLYDSERSNFEIRKDVKVVLINRGGRDPLEKERNDD